MTDVKGANLLVDTDGVVKLADFGCSKLFQAINAAASNCRTLLGTPFFMAPVITLVTVNNSKWNTDMTFQEVIRGQLYGRSADVWSLGCTVLEMATGQPPWSDKFVEIPAAMYHIGMTQTGPDIPEHLSTTAKDFIRNCCKVDKDARWKVKQLLQHPFVQ